MAQHSIREGYLDFTPPQITTQCSTFYKIIGDLDNGTTPLVLLHGGPGGGHEYLLSFAALWDRYRIPVVLYDQVGCAASTHLRHTAGDASIWCMDLFVAELDNLLDKLRLRNAFDLFGHSWGGMLAAEFASRRPKGLRRLILASALASWELNAAGVQLIRERQAIEVQLKLNQAEKSGDWVSVSDITTKIGSQHVCRTSPLPPELSSAARNKADDATVYSTMWGPHWLAPKGSLDGWTSIPGLERIGAPTLVYNGEFDTSHDVATYPFFELIPRVRWVTFAGSGHMCHLEVREKVIETVGRFLLGQ